MYYVEFLRARKVIYWTAGWLALAFALALWARLESGPGHHPHTPLPIEAFMGGGALVASIIATILGCALSHENNGHLALAWTKPASRVQLAVQMSLVDIGAIYVAFALGLVFGFGLIEIFGFGGYVVTDSQTLDFFLRSLLSPLAWYGLTRAATASMRGRAGAVAATLWIVGSVVVGLDQSHLLSGIFGFIVSALDKINPMYYFQLTYNDQGQNKTMVQSMVLGLSGLVALAVVGYAAALAQWRRLEA
ncbi:MAG TPA: hypothetical protein VKT51_08310 [Candidatus Eremiobacteraceae bacterium]|nr:hypothetical protein [Candidatus Eremiobacteraceae bacterium]